MSFKNDAIDECPECGSRMVIRTNKTTQNKFLGCSNYPDCRGTREYFSGDDSRFDKELPSEKTRNNDRRRWENAS